MKQRILSMLVVVLCIQSLSSLEVVFANEIKETEFDIHIQTNRDSTQYPLRPVFSEDDEDLDRKEIVIVTAKGDMNELIQEIKDQVPEAVIRKKFTTLYHGFTMELPKRELGKLEEIEAIERVDRLAYFEANIETSVPFIGAGHLDRMGFHGTHLTGKGVKVAVIDTGIDYRHPDLQINYRGGYDVVDDDSDPMETQPNQGVPTLHGTHVSGIIAANGSLKGVAPEAELYVYRALGPGGQGTTEQVIEAIERAVEDGVDVINLSLGNTVNGPDWPTSIALDKAVEAGVVAVTSNGNSGPKMWTVGSPGTSSKAISVGASAPPIKTPYITLAGETKELTLLPMGGALPWNIMRDLPLVEVGYGTKEEFAEIEAEGKIALIKRGLIPFNEKVLAAHASGAEAVIIYNNLSGSFVGAIEGGVKIPAVSVSKEDGEWLLQHMEKKKKEDLHVRTVYRKEQDFIAPFSSRGPVTHSWEVKPDLVAPGVSINSTIPRGYLSLNGTSMSSPHVAGAAALILQAHPDWNPEQVKAALMNTSKKLYTQEGEPYFPHEQGAGRIQVDKAVAAKTLVYPAALTFGKWTKDDLREKRTLRFTIDNQDDVARTYHVIPPFDVPDGIQWKVPYATTIAPGEKKEIELSVDLMPSVLAEGLHHGDIFIEGGTDKVSVPFVFFIEEPDYPRLMSFHFGHGDKVDSYRYELYLPGGAEEVGIAVYDPDTFQFLTYLDVQYDLGRGMVGGEIHDIDLEDGIYKALVYAKQEGREDAVEAWILIGAELPPKSQGTDEE
ncbi:S8 family serine peptidase [Alkalihalobacillus pseudalcaliphilus]|uniref:S8 family serine peptidase n=1 Tax=Alkalihalobacillus pseudalcaliphilus TaxID=79884 RepID=UPI00235DEF87|nr:S8 family serine peptidase [Alkalihalobacillus pseudalcaliphilus]